MDEVSARVRRFIVDRIDSLGQLEVLLLLRSDPGRRWNVTEVSRAVRSQPSWAELQLAHLRLQGLLVAERAAETRYRYSPVDPELNGVVEELSEAFANQRKKVIRLVFSKGRDERPGLRE